MEAFPYRLPLKIPYIWAKGIQHERRGLLIQYGNSWGEVAPPPHAVASDVELLAEFHRVTHGLNPDGDDFIELLDKRQPNCRIRCGITTAWHAERETFWGEKTATVPVNGLITGNEIEEQVRFWQTQGVSTFKIKIDGSGDVGRVRRLRQAAGDEALIRLDANECWHDNPLERLQELENFSIDYIEQPVPKDEIEQLQRLHKESSVAIALDEAASDPIRIGELLSLGCGSVIILKPQRLGGPDRTLEAMRIALDAGARVVVTNSLETSVGVHAAANLAAHLPQPIPPCGLATSHYFAEDVAPPPIIEEGKIAVKMPTLPAGEMFPRI